MKIAYILPSLQKTGPIIYTRYLINALIGIEGVSIKIYYFKDIVEIDMGVECEKINFFTKINLGDFDIIHTHMAIPDLYALYNLKNVHNKWVVTSHDMYKKQLFLTHNYLKASLISFLWGKALKKVKYMVVFSEAHKKYYQRIIGDKEYKIIPTGVNKYKINKICNIDNNKIQFLKEKYKIIGSSGLLTKRKGFHQLVDFLEKNKDYAVIITGDGEERLNLENYAKKKGVFERFFLVGFRENAVNYYKFYDVFVLPSYAEGLPLVILEAFSQGLPVVCTDLDNYKEYFNKTQVPLFDSDDINSLTNAILEVEQNVDYYKKMSKTLFKEKFSSKVMGKNYTRLYKNIIRKNK